MESISRQIFERFHRALYALLVVLALGTGGYWLLARGEHSLLDAFYMTVITVSTIGFGEVIDLSNNPLGRVFTILVALSGIGVLFYLMTNFTAYVVEGELKESFWRKTMEKAAKKLNDHYIICGIGSVGAHILSELRQTQRDFAIVDITRESLRRLPEEAGETVFIEGDATENESLEKAGVVAARGLFAVTGDDNQNLVICLTAKQYNPDLYVVAECSHIRNREKMRRAGADSVVSPSLIGGLRMASEMIRPTVVSFLDTMLRDRDRNLRVEELCLPKNCAGKTLAELPLGRYPKLLPVAIQRAEEQLFNPDKATALQARDVLIFIGDPSERNKLEAELAQL